MKSRTSLKEVLRAMAEESQGRPSPSIDQLIAYHRGELSESEREEVQDYLCRSPEATQFLLHLSHVREMEELTDQVVADDKKSFFKRLGRRDQEEVSGQRPSGRQRVPAEGPGPDSSKDPRSDVVRQSDRHSPPPWPSRLQTAYAMAAAFFILSVALFLWPAMNTADTAIHQLIIPVDRVRGEQAVGTQTMKSGDVLRVVLPVEPEEAGRVYELRIFPQDVEEPLLFDLARSGEDEGEVSVDFLVRADLRPGMYAAAVYPATGENRQRVAGFPLEIVP